VNAVGYTRIEVPARQPLRVAVVGVGWMGRFHAESVARRVPGLALEAIADPDVTAARQVASRLGVAKVAADPATVLADPHIDAVVIASPPRFHPAQMREAAAAGKAVFCEKPAALTLAELDAALADVEAAGVPLQIGFNRRYAAGFARGRRLVRDGDVGTPHLMRSLTRDPAPLDPAIIKPYAVFLETLIHDFDILNWFNAPASPLDVRAVADALIRPDWAHTGLLDTAVVTIRYDNGALATAEASLQTNYGYDVRLEVFGPDGMVTAGGPPWPDTRWYGPHGATTGTAQLNVELFRDAYVAELADFRDLVHAWRAGEDLGRFTAERPSMAGGRHARQALAVAQASIVSYESGATAVVDGCGRAG
jgi:myo-inositol 2-dehydrogenase/D-chiro-inositol 1-dehydrogenase